MRKKGKLQTENKGVKKDKKTEFLVWKYQPGNYGQAWQLCMPSAQRSLHSRVFFPRPVKLLTMEA